MKWNIEFHTCQFTFYKYCISYKREIYHFSQKIQNIFNIVSLQHNSSLETWWYMYV